MKNKLSIKSILLSAVCVVSFFAFARQEKVIKIFKDGAVINEYVASDIDYIQVDDLVNAPGGVSASVSGASITITWGAVSGATYKVFRSPDNVNFTLLANGVKGTSYTDNAPLRGVNYYRVTAMVDGVESGYTSSAAATLTDNGMESGIYLGVYGFNQALYEYPVLRLDATSISGFNGFIDGLTMKNGTLLYYSVEQALNSMQSTTYPSDLSSIALVTFTDGLDQGSMMKNDAYENDMEYLDALNRRIKTETVAGKKIAAYSIGVRGSDVTDISKFRENLKMLASATENATEVTSMSEVNAKFQEIAQQLSKSNYVQTINLKMPGVANGTLVRFTFDNVKSASNSKIYIEGRFNLKNKSLDDVKYVGLTSTSGSSVKGTVEDIFVSFTFENVQNENNYLIRSEYTDEWTSVTSNSTWQINSEFDKSENSEIHTERSSAAIMLVLDCSSSLGSQFSTAQSNAKGFIKTLYDASVNDPTLPEQPNSGKQTFTVNGISFNMIQVNGGTYQMGSNDGYSNERPVHSETIATFSIGETEVTQALWQAVMFSNPSKFIGNNLPVEQVSWDDCQRFISKLNQLTGARFRLPTEAEWEYAARGGDKSNGYTYSGSNTIGDVAWYDGNSGSKTHLVAQKQSNELGIFDMSGNVWEWCSDNWSENYSSPRNSTFRVNRGGSWYITAAICRVANRNCYPPDSRLDFVGLRLAL